tara:strand:- start:376 stop:675 length:300 start_codon:yes stop_codon:yes gene_type:complete
MFRKTTLFTTLLAGSLSVLGPALRADDDAQRARESVNAGYFVPLETLIKHARSRHPGRVVEVELEDDEYEIEILRGDGTKVELEYDARTGELLEEEAGD